MPWIGIATTGSSRTRSATSNNNPPAMPRIPEMIEVPIATTNSTTQK
jgi:hypothetical protein